MTLDRAINVMQLGSIVGGILFFGIETGRKDERLDTVSVKVSELASIVQDLAKAQVASASGQASSQRELDQLRTRIERLEQGQ
jgi:outer membrane murein-binding lipoprotein Lpp